MWQTSTRLLQLLAMLQARRDWSGQDLASRLGVSTRTIRTDVERLRELGYPVDATPGVGGGYRLGQGTTMPPLLLDDEEVVAVAIGLRTSTGSGVTGIEEASLRALVKLEQLMPSRLRHRIDAMRAATVSIPGTGPTVDSEVLGAIAGTIRASERLRFSYVDHDGNQTVRTAEPERLVAGRERQAEVHLGPRVEALGVGDGQLGLAPRPLPHARQVAVAEEAHLAQLGVAQADPHATTAPLRVVRATGVAPSKRRP